jgi:hypothetical protein
MKPTGQPTGTSNCRLDTQFPFMESTVSDVKDCSLVLNRPKVGGASLASNDKPLSPQLDVSYKSNLVDVDRERVSREVRRKVRRAKSLPTDEDLHYYLVTEFAMVPRSCGLLRQMVIKARNYLHKFDLTAWTNKQIYKNIMASVRSAMVITPEEESIRASLKNDDVLEGMQKHAKLVVSGDAGRTGFFFKSNKQLPSSK